MLPQRHNTPFFSDCGNALVCRTTLCLSQTMLNNYGPHLPQKSTAYSWDAAPHEEYKYTEAHCWTLLRLVAAKEQRPCSTNLKQYISWQDMHCNTVPEAVQALQQGSYMHCDRQCQRCNSGQCLHHAPTTVMTDNCVPVYADLQQDCTP
jgi:hypothetical protein